MIEHDILGAGIGPFNLGLAALLSRHPELTALFLDKKAEFRWHDGMILPGTTLQVPFLADLVTLADPTHPLSFLAYLAEADRLYKFYFYETFQIPREEYDDYCRWASRKLASCRFGECVKNVRHDAATDRFRITSERADGSQTVHGARHLVLGIGTTPHLPPAFARHVGPRLFHTADFARRRDALSGHGRVVVAGSGQSAAECVLSLLSGLDRRAVEAGAEIVWITRSDGFFPMEYSKLGLEHFTPDYLRHFQALPSEKRRAIVKGQGLLYKGISAATIAAIFDLLYERSIGGRDTGLRLVSNCEVEDLDTLRGGQGLRLCLRHRHLDTPATLDADALVAGTGYRHAWPVWLEALKDTILATDEAGDLVIGPHFQAERRGDGTGSIFVQNAETFHQGVGAPDLGLGAYRNALIVNTLLGREHYRVSAPSAFQTFGLHAPASPRPIRRDLHALAS